MAPARPRACRRAPRCTKCLRLGSARGRRGALVEVHLGGSHPCSADAYGQTKRCLEIIEAALTEAGASLADVVRTRVYLVRTRDFEEAGRAHGEAFADVRPANTTLTVKELVDPRWLVEVEADAVIAAESRRVA